MPILQHKLFCKKIPPARQTGQACPRLTGEEQECLQKFKNLSPIDRGRIMERMETMLNSYAPEQKENVS